MRWGYENANHTHSIPSLSGTAANSGSHTHGFSSGGSALVIDSSTSAVTAHNGFVYGTTPVWWNNHNKNISGIAYSGDHGHSVTTNASTTGGISANHAHAYTNKYVTGVSGVQSHAHYVTATGSVASSFAGAASSTGKTGSNAAFSVLDPYITVYMYKRVK